MLVPRGPWNPLLHGPAGLPVGAQLMKSVSLDRLEQLERGVRVYYDASGKYPRSLEDLVSARIIQDESLRDPYGRTYRYILRSEDGKFGLYGRECPGRNRPRSLLRQNSRTCSRHPTAGGREAPPG